MAGPAFVHLHTHSEFSLLDGAARLDALVQRAADLGMDALALTDHGAMYGALDFYEKCRKKGIKPIIGVEAYITPGDLREKKGRTDKNAFHLLLLAENLAGYKNLLKLTTIAALEGFYYKPRIDHRVLEEHKEGIIVTSACLSGEVCSALLGGDYQKALAIAGSYRDLLGPDHYYIELQNHGLDRQKHCNDQLLKIARDLRLRVVCTNDVHYLEKTDSQAHDVLLCIGTGATVDDQNRLRYDADEFFMKSPQEMAALFPDCPEALEQTAEIAARCNVELEFGRAPMPAPGIPHGHTAQSYLREQALLGLERKIGNHPHKERYKQRLDYELGIIEQTGFAPYFLIVRDFAVFAREQGIFFGVRGSAAGSLASYCLDITDIDPVDYDLTFERFLNPERIQMPDIDMDFEDTRRDEVLQYVTRKYGEDHVAQIITFGTLAARAAIRDVGRALGMGLPQVNRIVSQIPTQPLHVTIGEALERNPELRQLYDRDAQVRRLLDTARRLEGISRHSSVHAAGVVICNEPLVEYTPLQRTADGGLVTQYPAGALERIGLLKMDFLGLINLSILARALKNIEQSRNLRVQIERLPLDDAKTFEMLGAGETTGIFQLESMGMRRWITELKPTSVRDLAALVALYRPGPMAHIPTFVRAKHGLERIQYPHERLKPILEETYGVIVYQDQVLRIAQAIAGFTLGQADVLRKAMGKKIKEEMARQRQRFIAGAQENGISRQKASEIFDLIEPFAGYAFNKAHSVCYAMLAYQTAYLKANYPVEYMAALLSCYMNKADKLASCMAECSRMRIPILPPDVNRSRDDFTPQGDAILFGLEAVKNVGRAAVEAILAARSAGGPFRSLQDFCRRTLQHGAVTRSTIEALIKCGAFHSIHPNRRALLEQLDAALQAASSAVRAEQEGQAQLFGADHDAHTSDATAPPVVPEFPEHELLALEKDLLGTYLSGHPLRRWRTRIEEKANASVASLAERKERDKVLVGGIITRVKAGVSKKTREPMAFLTLEDLTGSVPVTVFPSAFREFGRYAAQDAVVLIEGTVSRRERVREDEESEGAFDVELLAERILPLNGPGSNGSNGNGQRTSSSLHIRLNQSHCHLVRLVRSALEQYPGTAPVILHIEADGREHRKRTTLAVDPSEQVKDAVARIIGRSAVWTE
ncbi:MAG: DNA polymerase III subunit alpha [Chthonomonadales bacterium]